MHAEIIQISKEEIHEDDYITASDFYESCQDFADYVSDEIDGECYINKVIPELFDGIFKCEGRKLTFISANTYMSDWLRKVKELSESISMEQCKDWFTIYKLSNLTKYGHLNGAIRFSEFGDYPGTFLDMMQYLYSHAKLGDTYYIGGIVDYHF